MRGVQRAVRAMACATSAMPSSSAPGSIETLSRKLSGRAATAAARLRGTCRPTGPASSCPSTSRSIVPFAVIAKSMRSTPRSRVRVARYACNAGSPISCTKCAALAASLGQRRIVQVGIALQIFPCRIGREKRRAGGNARRRQTHDRTERADPRAGILGAQMREFVQTRESRRRTTVRERAMRRGRRRPACRQRRRTSACVVWRAVVLSHAINASERPGCKKRPISSRGGATTCTSGDLSEHNRQAMRRHGPIVHRHERDGRKHEGRDHSRLRKRPSRAMSSDSACSGSTSQRCITTAILTLPCARRSSSAGARLVDAGQSLHQPHRARAQLLVRGDDVDHQIAVHFAQPHHHCGRNGVERNLRRRRGFETRRTAEHFGAGRRHDGDACRTRQRRIRNGGQRDV